MSMAWETTEDDVQNVLNAHGLTNVDAQDFCNEQLNADRVEDAALRGNDMDTQTNYAYQSIEEQLKEAGLLDNSAPTKFA
jgi:hypothetical protein